MKERMIIHSIRKGSVQWNEDDRLQLVTLLAKAGYAVRIGRRKIQDGKKTVQYEYTVEAWEDENGISE